jgi:hypothetical protein
MTQKTPPAKIPDSWKISEAEIDAAWNKKSEQFTQSKSYFVELFKSEKGKRDN